MLKVPFEIEKVGHKSQSQLSCQTCSIRTISHPIQPVKKNLKINRKPKNKVLQLPMCFKSSTSNCH